MIYVSLFGRSVFVDRDMPKENHIYEKRPVDIGLPQPEGQRRCSVLQCVAVRCSALQCVAVYCSALRYVAVCCNVLRCVAVCCSVSQCVAVCRSVLQGVAKSCKGLQWLILSFFRCRGSIVAVFCSMLQNVAVYGSV